MRHGDLVGLLSTRDVAVAAALRRDDPFRVRVDAMMRRAPFSCPADSPLAAVVERMERERIGSAVVTRRGKPCGIFTTTDALRALRGRLLGRDVEPLTRPAVTPPPPVSHRPVTFPRVPAIRGPRPSDATVSWCVARL